MKQLNQFDLDMKSPGDTLARLASVTEVEHLVVVYDRIYFANLILRDAVAPNMHVHIISIEDFECLLGYCWKGSLFDILAKKRSDKDIDVMDFHEWMAGLSGHKSNPYLLSIFNEFQRDLTNI